MRTTYGLAITAATMVVALVAMLYGSIYTVPDLGTVSYGLPLRWGVNTVETIAGPVDRWTVDIPALTIDLVFWFIAIVLVQFLVSLRL